MAIDDSRRPEPAEPQPSPVGSEDGLSGNEFGRPPTPGEVGDEDQPTDEDQPAADA